MLLQPMERRSKDSILLDPAAFRWVQRAGLGAAVGYSVAQLSNWFMAGKDKPPTDLLTAAVLVAALLWSRKRTDLRGAGIVMIVTVWLEMHYSFWYVGNLNSASLPALPALVAGMAFLGERRVARAMGFVTAVTAPLAAELGRWFDPTHPGIGDPTTVVTLAASLFVIAQMSDLALDAREGAIGSLTHTERRLALLFASIPDGIIAIARDGTVEVANPSAGALLGVDSAAMVGRRGNEALATLGEVRNGVATLGSGTSLRHVEVTTTSAPGIGEQPKLVWLRDVTQRVVAEERERVITERLQSSKHMETLGQLAGGVAHDMNNMLQATFGGLDEIDTELEARGSLEGHKTVEELRQIWTGGTAIVRQLLAFARQRPGVVGHVDVGSSLNGLRGLFRRLVPEDIALDVVVDVGDARVAMDPTLFDQMVVNLVSNARDAVKAGGTIRVAARVARDEQAESPEPRLMITVQDDGMGMSEDVKRRLFEPFFTTKEVGRGTGLGLSIAYSAVKQGSGDIRVESALGKGTTFTLSFPLAKAERAVAKPSGKMLRARPGETILLIDDHPQVRRSTARVLTSLGYRVLEASNGAEGVAIALCEHVDLVVTDVVMPVMGGPEAVAEITRHRPETRALFVSGYTRDLLNERGAQNVLLKPFRLPELSARVRAMIDQPPGESVTDGPSG